MAIAALVILVVFVSMAALILNGSAKRDAQTRAMWRRVADDLGFEGRLELEPRMHGSVGGVDVTVDVIRDTDSDSTSTYTRVRAGESLAVPSDLRVAGRGLAVALERALGSTGVQTGDRDFDPKVLLHGDPAHILATLDAETRDRLREAVRTHGFEVKEGVVVGHGFGMVGEEPALRSLIDTSCDLAQRLTTPTDLVERLAANAETEPNTDVAAKVRAVLFERFPTHPRTRALAEAQVVTGDARARLDCALFLGDPIVLRDVALANLQHEDVALALAACEAIAQCGAPADYTTIVAATTYPAPAVAAAAARALGALEMTPAEPDLIRLLSHDEALVQIAACESLGHVGTLTAVEPLLPLTKGTFENRQLKEAASSAIALIRTRSGATARDGALSVAEEAGTAHLSLAAEQHAASLSLSEQVDATTPAEQHEEAEA